MAAIYIRRFAGEPWCFIIYQEFLGISVKGIGTWLSQEVYFPIDWNVSFRYMPRTNCPRNSCSWWKNGGLFGMFILLNNFARLPGRCFCRFWFSFSKHSKVLFNWKQLLFLNYETRRTSAYHKHPFIIIIWFVRLSFFTESPKVFKCITFITRIFTYRRKYAAWKS